ncbi:hypothetical protein WT98_20440 [Burkholderia territorii]|nr:hypothetical protein WT98_20440 [Burkholderia territorii]
MRYADFDERFADRREAVPHVERHRGNQCVEPYDRLAALPRRVQECMQHGRSRALPARVGQHRDAADRAGAQQPSRRDRTARAGRRIDPVRNRVQRHRILVVQFPFRRNALLAHEHRIANTCGVAAQHGPVARFHPAVGHRFLRAAPGAAAVNRRRMRP